MGVDKILCQYSWQEFDSPRLYRSGKARAIGVSNYTIEHLEQLLSVLVLLLEVVVKSAYPSFGSVQQAPSGF